MKEQEKRVCVQKAATKVNIIEMTKNLDLLLGFFSIAGAICTLGWLLWYCGYGIDFTDEGFYLVWISNPFLYSSSTTQFGFIYHPLYQLLDGSIVGLRQANVLITFALASFLTNTLLGESFIEQSMGKWLRLSLCAGFATASLVIFDTWLLTPSYNSLGFQALMITTTGILLSKRVVDAKSILGWILIGVGGWLAFMAKPTTAAALGVAAGLYLPLASKLNIRLGLVTLATFIVLLIASAWVIDGSVMAFIERLRSGLELVGFLDGGHSFSNIIRIDDFILSKRAGVILVTGTALAFLSALFLMSDSKRKTSIGAGLAALFFFYTATTTLGMLHQPSNAGGFQGLTLFAVPLAVIFLGGYLTRLKGFTNIPLPQIALILLLLVLPHIYAFGTNGNYWRSGGFVGIFWVLSGVILFASLVRGPRFSRALLALGLMTQLLSVALILSGMEAPYRQPQPLRFNSYPVSLHESHTKLMLPGSYGQYLSNAIKSTRQAGFQKGWPVIDLTGQSPSVLYALGGINIGLPWIVGGYKGSDQQAIEVLKKVSCDDLGRSWILVEPEGPRSLSPTIVASFGANIETDYEPTASWETPQGKGGYKTQQRQKLMKPTRTQEEAVQSCNTTRAAGR